MDINTKTVTTRVHTAVAKTDEFKDVAILAVKRKLGLSDEAILSADATVGEDGSISVEVVEVVDDTPKASEAPDPDASSDDQPTPAPKPAPVVPAIPLGIVAN